MYYPIQIPYILNKEFSTSIQYSEEIIPKLKDFVICFWEMHSNTTENKTVENIIITDGCIDLVADCEKKQIGFAGFNQTNFRYKINLPFQSFGARFKPGAFFAITNLPATKAMNTFLPISAVDKTFDIDFFFSLPFKKAKEFLKSYLVKLVQGKRISEFLTLFDNFNDDIPIAVSEIYKKLCLSPRQCQRLFHKNFGLTPQMVLCILRFQKCLEILVSKKSSPNEILNTANYYDQAHLLKDFKRNIGLTPFELIRIYK